MKQPDVFKHIYACAYRGVLNNSSVEIRMIIISHYERPVSVIFLDSSSGISDPLAEVKQDHEIPAEDKKLVCHVCLNLVTDESQRIDIHGKNTHLGTNPTGITYTFNCFAEACGCAVYGIPSMEHSWFHGYHWQISACQQCGEHLGWLFKGETRFFGLIQGRIVRAKD